MSDLETRVIVFSRMRSAMNLLLPLLEIDTELLNLVLRLSELAGGRSGTPPASKDSIENI